MDEAGQHLLAGAAFAGDENAGIGRRHLLGEPHDALHRHVAEEQGVAFLRHRLEHGGDHLGVGRQRQIFLGAGPDGADRGGGIGADAAGDDRDVDALLTQAVDHPRDVELHVHHEEIGALARAQRDERLFDVVDMGDGGAARERDLAGGADIAFEGSEDEETHGVFPVRSGRP